MGHVARIGEMKNAHTVLVGNLKGKKVPLWRSMCRWERNIRMDCRDMRWEGVDWIHLARV